MKKVLVVHASYGEGHKRAAQALEGVCDAKWFDLLDFCHPWIKKFTTKAYLDMTRGKGAFWSLLFHSSKIKLGRQISDSFCDAVFYAFMRFLRAERPDVVITTHPFVTPLLLELKKEWDLKVIVVVTDIKVHPWWVYKDVDHYFAALEETRRDLLSQGVAEDKISSGFVPLRPSFWQAYDEAALRRKFGIDDRPCILFVSSIRGKFPLLKRLLDDLSKDYNLFIACGRNEKLKNQIEALNMPGVKAFGFTEEIWELIQCSFLLVSKPGGLTVFEGIACKKFFIFTHFIPGQEKDNMNMLIAYGVGAYPRKKNEFLSAVNRFYQMQTNKAYHYPLAAKDMRIQMAELIESI